MAVDLPPGHTLRVTMGNYKKRFEELAEENRGKYIFKFITFEVASHEDTAELGQHEGGGNRHCGLGENASTKYASRSRI